MDQHTCFFLRSPRRPEFDCERSSYVCYMGLRLFFFFSSRRRHTRFDCDWSSDVCSSDLSSPLGLRALAALRHLLEAGYLADVLFGQAASHLHAHFASSPALVALLTSRITDRKSVV